MKKWIPLVTALVAVLTLSCSLQQDSQNTPPQTKQQIVAPPKTRSVSLPELMSHPNHNLPLVKAITTGPKYHWFAYYDKLQFDPTGRFALSMEVDFENRSPAPEDTIKIGMIDLQDNNRWIELGQSKAWGWQQGCMLQWIPGSKSKIIWNDREDDKFVCRIFDVFSRQTKTLPFTVYSIAPDGKTAVTTDFRRIQDMRPGYGYAGIKDPYADQLAPTHTGIWKVDLEKGTKELIIPIAEVANIPWPGGDISTSKHYFNHLLISPDAKRFIFLHRWRTPGKKKWTTRMLTANIDGSDIRVIDDSGSTSHFIWKNPTHILAWSWHPSHKFAFYLFDDTQRKNPQPIGPNLMDRDGHCTYLPGSTTWILNDTYPDRQRKVTPYLFNTETQQITLLGRFHLPPEYRGEWRIDAHPRSTPDGQAICIDSAHQQNGRQMYLIDISKTVSPPTQ